MISRTGSSIVIALLTTTNLLAACQAFVVVRPTGRPSSTVRVTSSSTRIRAGSASNEFDFILREDGDAGISTVTSQSTTTTTTTSRRSRFAVQLGGQRHQGQSKVVLASVAAPPMNTEAAAEAMSELAESGGGGAATEGADPYAAADNSDSVDPFGNQLNKIQQYQEQKADVAATGFGGRLKQMDLQDIILTLILPSICVFAAGRWTFNRISERVNDKTDTLLASFANELVYHDGDFDEMKLCIDDYNKRLVYLGPLKRDKMLKAYLSDYAKRKTISPQSIANLSYVFTQFKLSEESAANLLVSLCRDLGTEKVSSSGKLLFLGSRILKSPQGRDALVPIKELIKSTYRDTSETVADTMIETSQQAMAEASYRTCVLSGGKSQSKLTDGWQVLGLDQPQAQRIFDEEKKEGFMTERQKMYGGQTQKYDKKGRHIDKEGKLENSEEAEEDDGDDDDTSQDAVSNVYECTECGHTMFIAKGRETKFFGEGFKCPECGAPKDKFKAREDFGED